MAGELQVVVRRANGRFVRRVQARSAAHARQLVQALEETYGSTVTVTVEGEVTGGR